MPNLPKVHILGEFKDGPWGGGNQFLKNLRQTWKVHEHYADDPQLADVILFNSYQQLLLAVELKRKYPSKLFIHRLGPIFHYHRRERGYKIDYLTLQTTKRLADLTIFQSQWSYKESCQLGFRSENYVIIGNAADETIFNKEDKTIFNPQRVKLIGTSWSTNINKGFDFYKYLDKYLDWTQYTMTFVGNPAIKFNNIKQSEPVDSHVLASELKKSDIFIAPFKYEAASNAILEALACGLPVVALDSGSNGEEIKRGGELFKNQEELLAKIDLVAENYYTYQSQIEVVSIEVVAQQYLKAIRQINSPNPPLPFWFYYYLKWKLS